MNSYENKMSFWQTSNQIAEFQDLYTKTTHEINEINCRMKGLKKCQLQTNLLTDRQTLTYRLISG